MAIGLGLGLGRFPFDSGRDFFRWVEYCEASHVDSIWQSDRLVSKEPMLETMSTMAALAGATERIRFGMNVASIALRDPLMTARQCATIDVLSDGRLLPAFGIGSALSMDYRATNTPTKRRGRKADEALTLVSRLWHEEEVSFEGEFFHYEQASIAPRPVNPNIPLWIGGSSTLAQKRTARIGTGWLGGIESPAQVKVVVDGIKSALIETGRSIDDDHYGATFSFRFGSTDDAAAARTMKGLKSRFADQDPLDYVAIGDADVIHERIRAFLAAGCQKFVMIPIASDGEDFMAQTRRFVEEILPVYEGQ